MAEQLSYVIVGNGIAGVTAAETLRAEDSSVDITVIADHPYPVYNRPALKDFLAGLGLKIQISLTTPQHFARIAQLTQRTNQFNLTTRRHTDAKVPVLLIGASEARAAFASGLNDLTGIHGRILRSVLAT